jgi:hypothetical protein
MGTLIYTEQAGDKLKLVAEVEDIDDAALAVDALIDQEPKLAGTEFTCFNTGSRQYVTAEEEVVQPRRKITIRGGVNGAAKSAPRRQTRKPAAPKAAAAKPAAKRTTRKPAAKPAAAKTTTTRKAAPKAAAAKPKAASKPAAKKSGGSPFKRNAKGDE